MDKNLIEIKYRQETVGIRTYRTKFFAEITHKGLNDFILLSAEDRGILQSKVNSQVAKLEDKWNKIVFKENVYKNKEASLKEAEERTEEAIEELKKIHNILLHTLEINDTVDWELLKDKTKFKIPSPEKELPKLLSAISKPKEPSTIAYPNKPEKENYVLKLSFFDKLIKSKKKYKN